MTDKTFKVLRAVLAAATLVAGLTASTPAGAAHNPDLYAVSEIAEDPEAGLRASSDGGSTSTATIQQYLAGEAAAGGDNGDGRFAGNFRCCYWTAQYSSDGGSTWTATGPEYHAGEHAGGDNGDGPAAGTFRARTAAFGLFSTDGGSTWHGAGLEQYFAGEADAGGDNGDGPAAGTFRYRSTWLEYSFNGGSTWTEWAPNPYLNSLNPRYLAGEADAGGDNGDGPDAGTFRYRISSTPIIEATTRCPTSEMQIPSGSSIRVRERSVMGSWPSLRGLSCAQTWTYTWNVDDGIEPAGSWCVAGPSAMICDGEGYTYREAREELGYGDRGPSARPRS